MNLQRKVYSGFVLSVLSLLVILIISVYFLKNDIIEYTINKSDETHKHNLTFFNNNFLEHLNLNDIYLNHILSSAMLSLKNSFFSNSNIELSYFDNSQKLTNLFNNNIKDYNVPFFTINKKKINFSQSFEYKNLFIDDVYKSYNVYASLYIRLNEQGDMTCIATNIPDAEQNRAINKLIPFSIPSSILNSYFPSEKNEQNPIMQKIFNGQTFKGILKINSEYHYIHFERIINQRGRIIGMFSVSVKLKDFIKFKNKGTSAQNNYIISLNPWEYGQQIKEISNAPSLYNEQRDTSGRYYLYNYFLNSMETAQKNVQYSYIHNKDGLHLIDYYSLNLFEPWNIAVIGTINTVQHIDESSPLIYYFLRIIFVVLGFTIIILLLGYYRINNSFNKLNKFLNNISIFLKELKQAPIQAVEFIQNKYNLEFTDSNEIIVKNEFQEARNLIIECYNTALLFEKKLFGIRKDALQNENINSEVYHYLEHFLQSMEKVYINLKNSNYKIQVSITNIISNQNEFEQLKEKFNLFSLDILMNMNSDNKQINDFIKVNQFLETYKNKLYRISDRLNDFSHFNERYSELLSDAQIISVNSTIELQKGNNETENLTFIENELNKFIAEYGIIFDEMKYILNDTNKLMSNTITEVDAFINDFDFNFNNAVYSKIKIFLKNNILVTDKLSLKLNSDINNLNEAIAMFSNTITQFEDLNRELKEKSVIFLNNMNYE